VAASRPGPARETATRNLCDPARVGYLWDALTSAPNNSGPRLAYLQARAVSLVGDTGIEPVTSSVSGIGSRSTPPAEHENCP